MQTVLITGAEGFVGSHLVPHLRQNGREVVAGVRNRARKLIYERQGVHALVCDVTDAINVARVVASVRPDGVVHLAGMARPADAADDPLLAYQSIVTAWANVLDAVRRTVPRARVLLVSAADVYGPAGDGPVRETTPPRPATTFGSFKHAAETVAATFFRDYHLNLTVARPFAYTGAGQPAGFCFGAAARQLAEGEPNGGPPELWLPDLDGRRDVLHVQDVVTAYQRLLEDGRPNEVYNVCSGRAVATRELVMSMATECGRSVELRELPAQVAKARWASVIGDNTKLREELGWTPQRTAAQAVRELLAGMRVRAESTA